MRFCCSFVLSMVMLFLASSAEAALTTTPYLFTDQALPSTGHFEWDEFSGSVFAPFAPDVATSSSGAGWLEADDFTAQPFDGPPLPLVSSTENIYSGGTLVDFDLPLSGLSTAEAHTTVVLQLATQGDLDPLSIVLDGVGPDALIDRGIASAVANNVDDIPGGALADTHFYWAMWQAAAASDYLLEFTNRATHTSLAQVRVDYFNSATPFIAVAASSVVPEPATMTWAVLAGCGALVVGLRRRYCLPAA